MLFYLLDTTDDQDTECENAGVSDFESVWKLRI